MPAEKWAAQAFSTFRLVAFSDRSFDSWIRVTVRGQVGAVAHLGERRVRNAEVEGSTPFGSTNGPVGRFQPACFSGDHVFAR